MWKCENRRSKVPVFTRFLFLVIFTFPTFPTFPIFPTFPTLPTFSTLSAAEIHAVWDHSGRGLYPGSWPKTIQLLKQSHVTDLFVNVAGADFAHYPSACRPKTGTLTKYGDQMAQCLAAAKGSGIRVHAWVICFNMIRNDPKQLELFRKRGWRLADKGGKLTTYLNPANENVRRHVLAAVDEIQTRYPVAGVHLDFVRWGDATVKPANAAGILAQFVSVARLHVKRPKLLSAAVYGKHPACVAAVGQDWPRWLDFDIVDYVVPMDYTENEAKFVEFLRQQSAKPTHARRTVVGIGVTATGCSLSAQKVIRQIALARKYGLAGQSLFDLDETLSLSILPALRKGTW